MIRLIVFDAGDVLYDTRPFFEYFYPRVTEFLKKHGAKTLDEDERLWKDLGRAASVGKITLHEAHRTYLRRLGLSEELVDEYERIDNEAFDQMPVKDKKIRDVLLSLKKRGYAVAVLSDSRRSSRAKERLLERIGLGGLFDVIFVSSEIGHEKPDREAYEAVLQHFNVRPEEAVFVGHDKDELAGARGVGMKTISYRGPHKADYIIRSFHEILEVVERLD